MIVDRVSLRWMLLTVAMAFAAVFISWVMDYRAKAQYLEQHRITHVNQAEIIRLLKERNCYG